MANINSLSFVHNNSIAVDESVGQITAQQRDATIRRLPRRPGDVAAVPDDACLARAVSARPLPTLDWKTATAEQRTAFIARVPIPELLAALSREQRLEHEDRIDGLRAVQVRPIAAVTHH